MAVDEGGDSWHLTDREDAFEDASDAIDSQDPHSYEHGNDHQGVNFSEVENLRQLLDEKTRVASNFQEEREMFLKEAALIKKQLRALVSCEPEEVEAVDNAPPREILAQCVLLIENAVIDRSEKEKSIKNLEDRVEDLCSIHQIQRSVEVASDRIISAIDIVARREEPLSDYSVIGKLDYLEKGVNLVLEHCNWYANETNQLRQCLLENGATNDPQEGFGAVFSTARAELNAIKVKEMEKTESISLLQFENKKLAEEIEKRQLMMESLRKEVEMMKGEVDVEKNRYIMTKEKLSMAVTKGKALVQQRDSLKQSLTEKTIELEKCLAELHEKVRADETRMMEIERYENQVKALQKTLSQKEYTLENLQQMLQHLDGYEELQSTDADWMLNAVVYLNNVHSEWNNIRKILSQFFSIIDLAPEHHPATDLGRLNWLLDERNELHKKYYTLNDALSVFDFPEDIALFDVVSRINWIESSYGDAKREADLLRNKIKMMKKDRQHGIDLLTVLLVSEFQENEYMKDEMIDFIRIGHQMVIEKDAPALIDGSVSKFDDMRHRFVLQSVNLAVFYELLEEDTLMRSEMPLVSEKLSSALQEISFLRNEKASLEKDLIKSEEKSSVMKEKLSLAVKKGKALVQDRENMKRVLDEKNSDIENLKRDLKDLESNLNESLNQTNVLLADSEKLVKMEADCHELKNEKDQLLINLQMLTESVDSINVSSDEVISNPLDKITWLAGFVQQSEEAKKAMNRDLTISNSLYAEAEEKTRLMERNLLIATQSITELENGKEKFQNECREAELRIEEMREEARKCAEELMKCSDDRNALDKKLKNIELELSMLEKEREDIRSMHTDASTELEKVKVENDFNITSLIEAQNTIRSLQESLDRAETNVSLLAQENNAFVKEKASLEDTISFLQKECMEAEQSIGNLRVESTKYAEEFANRSDSRNELEKALKDAEIELSMMKKDQESFQAMHDELLTKLEKMNSEKYSKDTVLFDAQNTIKTLQESLGKAETNILLLTSESNDFARGKTTLEETISSLQERCKETENHVEKLKLEARKHFEEFSECSEAKNTLDGVLKNAETELSILKKERDEIQAMHVGVSLEMEKIKVEHDCTAESFTEAQNSIKALQSSLETAENRLASLVKEKTFLEESIPSLQEELAKSYSNVTSLENAKITAERMIVSLTSNLETCMEELAVANKKLEGKSLHLDREVSDLAFQTENYSLVSVMNSCLEKEFEGLKRMDEILGSITSNMLQNVPNLIEDHPFLKGYNVMQIPSSVCNNFVTEKDVAESFKGSNSMKIEFIDYLSKRLASADDAVMFLIQQMLLLQEKSANIHETEKTITFLENCITTTINELQFEVENDELSQKWSPETREVMVESHDDTRLKLADNLSLSIKTIQRLVKAYKQMFNETSEEMVSMNTKMQDSKETLQRTLEERNTLISKLHETQDSLHDLRDRYEEQTITLSGLLAVSDTLREKELELVTARELLEISNREKEKNLNIVRALEPLLSKTRESNLSSSSLEGEDSSDNSDDIEKLQRIVDSVTELQTKVNTLSKERANTMSAMNQKSFQVEEHLISNAELENSKRMISETTVSLKKICDLFGSNSNFDDDSLQKLIPFLEKQILMLRSEDEHSSAQIRSLKNDLQSCEKRINELSSKVKCFEDPKPLSNHERSIKAESSSSEISKVDNMGLVSKTAAHVRTMRKGSSDHLALNVDSESVSLLSYDDKGREFKSLSTSGIIPKQGKFLADKVDGLWVTGGRMLMNRPKARLSLVAYTLFVHLWLLILII